MGRRTDGKDGGVITLGDVAEHAGVSRSTASLVVRNSALIKEETHKKVRESMRALGYVYNHSAASLRTRKTKTLGVVLADLSNPFYAELSLGIRTACHDSDYMMIFADTREDWREQRLIVQRLIEHNVAGVFICPVGQHSKKDIDALQAAGIPTVLIMRYLDGDYSSYVGPDNIAGMKLIVDHLVGLGHREIAYIGGPPARSSSVDRLDGFRRAMSSYGLGTTPRWFEEAEINRKSAMLACDRLLDSGALPSAICCYNDIMAIGVMLSLIRRGLVPSQDISVTGFDDIPEAVLWTPELTTVSIGAVNIGKLAASELLKQIEDPSRSSQKIIVQPKLIVRSSTSAKKV